MVKKWETVMTQRGFNIQIRAEVGDCMDYRIEPPFFEGETFPNIGDAVTRIEEGYHES